MSMRKQVVTAGVLGLIIALGLIAGSTYFLPSASHTSSQVQVSTQTVTVTQSGATQSTQASQSSQSSTGASQSESSSSSSSQAAGTGTVDVLLTDPPTLPSGVTAVFVTYSNVAVHVSGAGNQSGWTDSNTTGTINIVNLVNVSSTIATIKVSAGVYNELRFNISSAQVTYNGKNYTAFVQGAVLNVPIPGGIPVNATTSSAAIIDMHPTVVNIGSNSDPEFVISTAATGYCVPQQNVTGNMGQNGNQIDLVTAQWWWRISENYTSNIAISSATLTANSFSVTVTNTGTTATNLTALFIAPLGNVCPTATSNSSSSSSSTTTTSSQTTTSSSSTRSNTSSKGHGGGGGQVVLPTCLTGSAEFLVLDNGTILPINPLLPVTTTSVSASSQASWGLFGKTGYELKAGDSVTLTYEGSISFGVLLHPDMVATGVTPGDQYMITVLGQQALAATVVVAS